MPDDPLKPAESTRTGRDGVSSRERTAAQEQKAFASTPEGRRFTEMERTLAKLLGKLTAMERENVALTRRVNDLAQQVSLIPPPEKPNEAHLRPTRAGQIWGSGTNGVAQWEDSGDC